MSARRLPQWRAPVAGLEFRAAGVGVGMGFRLAGVDISPRGVAVAARGRAPEFRAASDAEGCARALAGLRRGATRCVLSLPAGLCRFARARLPAMGRAELRGVLAQREFWRDRLGVVFDEYHRAWRDAADADGTAVILAALPCAALDYAARVARAAGLRPVAAAVSCPRPEAGATLFVLDPDAPALSIDAAGPRVLPADDALAQAVAAARAPAVVSEEPVAGARLLPVFEAFGLRVAPPRAEAAFALARAAAALGGAAARADTFFFPLAGPAAPTRWLRVAVLCLPLLPAAAALDWRARALAGALAGEARLHDEAAAWRDGALAEARRLEDALARQRRLLEEAARVAARKARMEELFAGLEAALPAGARLTRLEHRPPAMLRLRGRARDAATAMLFAARLREAPAIAGVDLEKLSAASAAVDFVLGCRLAGAPATNDAE